MDLSSLFNRSVAAGWLILAVILLRLVLKKAPRWTVCLLWGLAALRLLCPFTLESSFSLVPSGATVPAGMALAAEPAIESGVDDLDHLVNPLLADLGPDPGDSVNPMQVWLAVGKMIWAVGVGVMGLYALLSYVRLKRRVRTALPLEWQYLKPPSSHPPAGGRFGAQPPSGGSWRGDEGAKGAGQVWLCDSVDTPFLLGLLRPRIYLPSNLEPSQMPLILAHERAHLRRGDHWWKAVGFLALTLHWFNPLVWLAYVLFCRDLELACDQRAVRDLKLSEKKEYAATLLQWSVERPTVAACPVAFGQGDVKRRVNNVLNYKKPGFWLILIAILVCIVLALCFLTDPKTEKPLTLEKVVELSQKGEDLTWSDFEDYPHEDVGSGLCIWYYDVDETFHLLIGGSHPAEPPMYIRLCTDDGEEQVDIREIDVAAYLRDRQAARPWDGLPQTFTWSDDDIQYNRVILGSTLEYTAYRLDFADRQDLESGTVVFSVKTNAQENGTPLPVTETVVYAREDAGVYRVDVHGFGGELLGRNNTDRDLSGVLEQYGGPTSVERREDGVDVLWYCEPGDDRLLWFEVKDGQLNGWMGFLLRE